MIFMVIEPCWCCFPIQSLPSVLLLPAFLSRYFLPDAIAVSALFANQYGLGECRKARSDWAAELVERKKISLRRRPDDELCREFFRRRPPPLNVLPFSGQRSHAKSRPSPFAIAGLGNCNHRAIGAANDHRHKPLAGWLDQRGDGLPRMIGLHCRIIQSIKFHWRSQSGGIQNVFSLKSKGFFWLSTFGK
jgi:hypothetical protein